MKPARLAKPGERFVVIGNTNMPSRNGATGIAKAPMNLDHCIQGDALTVLRTLPDECVQRRTAQTAMPL